MVAATTAALAAAVMTTRITEPLDLDDMDSFSSL